MSAPADETLSPLATLPPIEQRFVLEYLKDFNGSAAYRRVKPHVTDGTARTEAARLLTKPRIQSALLAASARILKRMELTTERVLRELARLAFFDPRKFFDERGNVRPISDLDDDTVAALAGFEVFEEYEGRGEERRLVGYIKKFKLSDRKGALALAMKHLGLFERDNAQKTDPIAALLAEMGKQSALPVVANPPKDGEL